MDYIRRATVGACLGDHVNTDAIFPARYLVLFSPDEVGKHLFEDIDKELASKVKGKVVLGNIDFGCGSAREQGLTALKYGGVEMLVCKSYSRAFYRNGFNNAFPLFIADCREKMEEIAEIGDDLEANFTTGELKNLSRGRSFQCSPTPEFLIQMLECGGIWEMVQKNPDIIAKR